MGAEKRVAHEDGNDTDDPPDYIDGHGGDAGKDHGADDAGDDDGCEADGKDDKHHAAGDHKAQSETISI
eukprot:3428693-Pleurochrysis_carterae.AAC.1